MVLYSWPYKIKVNALQFQPARRAAWVAHAKGCSPRSLQRCSVAPQGRQSREHSQKATRLLQKMGPRRLAKLAGRKATRSAPVAAATVVNTTRLTMGQTELEKRARHANRTKPLWKRPRRRRRKRWQTGFIRGRCCDDRAVKQRSRGASPNNKVSEAATREDGR